MNGWAAALLVVVLVVGSLLWLNAHPAESPAPASWRCSAAIPCPATSHAPAAAQR